MHNLQYVLFNDGSFDYMYVQGFLQALRLDAIDRKYTERPIVWEDNEEEEFIECLKEGLAEVYWRSL